MEEEVVVVVVDSVPAAAAAVYYSIKTMAAGALTLLRIALTPSTFNPRPTQLEPWKDPRGYLY